MNNLEAYDKKYTKGYGIQFPEGHIIRIYNNFISKFLPKKENSTYSSLDFGCGNGIHSTYLASKGYEVHGVDIIPEAIEQAKINNTQYKDNFNIIKNNNLIAQFKYKKFDLILANQSLYYLDDIELRKIIKQFYDILNTNGIVVFTMMSSKNYYSEYITEELPNGLSKVELSGRLNESTNINFVNNFIDLKKKFSLFMPLQCGIYDFTMLEGSSEHMYFVGIKKY